MEWSSQLFFVMFGIIVVGRFLGSVCFLQILRCFCHTPQINFREALFMCFAGMIRGAIAFGLVLRLDDSLPNKQVIVTTSLSLVLLTTLLFGSFLGLLSICLFGNDADEKKKKKTGLEEELLSEDEHKFSDEDSSFDEVLHPNLIKSQTMNMTKTQYIKNYKKMSTCRRRFK